MQNFTGPDIARLNAGILVERAPAVLPASGTTAYFTVTGWVGITYLFGVCTTACSATATNLSLVHVPTSPASVNKTIADVLAITSFDQGSLVVAELDGTNLVGGDGVAAQPMPALSFIVGPGSISATTSATNTGAFQWVCRYVPLTSGSGIVAA